MKNDFVNLKSTHRNLKNTSAELLAWGSWHVFQAVISAISSQLSEDGLQHRSKSRCPDPNHRAGRLPQRNVPSSSHSVCQTSVTVPFCRQGWAPSPVLPPPSISGQTQVSETEKHPYQCQNEEPRGSARPCRGDDIGVPWQLCDPARDNHAQVKSEEV